MAHHASDAGNSRIVSTFSMDSITLTPTPSNLSHETSAVHASEDGLKASDELTTRLSEPNLRDSPAFVNLMKSKADSSGEKDPFVSSDDKGKCEQKLSPTADTFHPFGLNVLRNVPVVAYGSGTVDVPETSASDLNREETSVDPKLGSPVKSHGRKSTDDGRFSTDTSITRVLKISGIYGPPTAAEIENSLEKRSQLHSTRRLIRFGDIYFIRCTHIGDAEGIYTSIKHDHPEWSIEYVAPNTFAQTINPGSPFVSAHEGQIALTARFPHMGVYDRSSLEKSLQDLLKVDGEFFASQKYLATEAGTFKLVVEFLDTLSASRAVERLDRQFIRGIEVSAAFHQPDLEVISLQHRSQPATPIRDHNDDGIARAMERMSFVAQPDPRMIAGGYNAMLSPTGRSFIPSQFTFSPVFASLPTPLIGTYNPLHSQMTGCPTPYTPQRTRYDDRYSQAQNAIGGPSITTPATTSSSWSTYQTPSPTTSRTVQSSGRYSSSRRQHAARVGSRTALTQSGHHNTVDVERIRSGADVRTTIMLRNIPNKVSQVMLKSIVDETSFGLYDFMYLRIDFANNCNVGYAFINFEDPWHISDFVKARSGQRWNHFNSDKVAEVSYATIQGKDCLVQKFRNSSVMLEHPAFRPKIFHTANHPLKGQEDTFPIPDNPSKMRRSVENAEHVGLFAPRSGQQFRDEQRHRRSQYDRGTRFAELEEECSFDDQLEQYSDGSNF